MDLFGQLLLTKLVQGEELSGKCDVLQKSTTGKFDPDDDLSVRHHHGNISKLNLQILRKLLPASIGGIHGNKDAKLRIHINCVSICEDELLSFLLLASENHRDLLSSNREDSQSNPVKLIKTSPGSRLGKSFVDSTKAFVIHLIRTVEDNNIFPQSFCHVLDCFSLASSSWACRSTTHTHPYGLC